MEETIYYNSPLGVLEIRDTQNKISKISFLDSPSTLSKPHAAPCSELLRSCVEQLDGYFSGSIQSFELPVMQQGTAFQQQVWSRLAQIPYGRTISYLALSKTIGNPKSIRAVGSANGKNNIAIVVPCHRVIGSNGTLVGYAGDLWRKKWLLDHEAQHARGVQTLF